MKPALSRIPYYLLPSLGAILWIGIFIAVVGMGPRLMNVDGDLGRHLTIGRYILDSGQIPTRDLFSHTLYGQSLTPHEWLSQVIFALAERWLGLDGVILVCGLVIATSFWLVFRLARSQSHSLLVAAVVAIIAMAASSLHWLSRPHIFTFLMLALWMNALQELRDGRLRRWWFMPLIMVLWVNLHGAFIAGFVTWGLYALGLAWDHLLKRSPQGVSLPGGFWRAFLMGGAGSFLVSFINPSGAGIWATSFGFIGNRYLVSHTAEYMAPNFQDSSTWPFLVMIGLVLLLFGLRSKPVEAAQVLPVAGWTIMGLYSVRNVPLFAIVAAPVLAAALSDAFQANRQSFAWLERLCQMDWRLNRTDQSLRGFLWPALIFAFVWAGYASGAKLDLQQQGNAFDERVFPVQAVDYLKANPQPGNMFNYFTWGGYLLYRLWPEDRVFIDGQTDFYGERLTRQYEQALTLSPGWEKVLDQYHIQWVLVPPEEPLAETLKNEPGWKVVYEDETAILITSSNPAQTSR